MPTRICFARPKLEDTFSCIFLLLFLLTGLHGQTNFSLGADITDYCSNKQPGAIDLTVTGTDVYSVQWSTGEITEDIYNLAAGSYSVTVIDNYGCSITEIYDVSIGSACEMTITSSLVECEAFVDIEIIQNGVTIPDGQVTIRNEIGEIVPPSHAVDTDNLPLIFFAEITDAGDCCTNVSGLVGADDFPSCDYTASYQLVTQECKTFVDIDAFSAGDALPNNQFTITTDEGVLIDPSQLIPLTSATTLEFTIDVPATPCCEPVQLIVYPEEPTQSCDAVLNLSYEQIECTQFLVAQVVSNDVVLDPADYTLYDQNDEVVSMPHQIESWGEHQYHAIIDDSAAPCCGDIEHMSVITIPPPTICDASAEVYQNIKNPCLVNVAIIVVLTDGTQLTDADVDVLNPDQQIVSLNHQVAKQPNSFDYEVTVIYGSEVITLSIPIPAQDESCIKKDCLAELIVNEFNQTASGKNRFVELMVTGYCNCEQNSDISKFIIDDNNGDMVPPGSGVTFLNSPENIGATSGNLRFKEHSNWQAVPNGSLIVIAATLADLTNLGVNLDPTDIDQNSVYVLLASDTTYLEGNTQSWSTNFSRYGYFDSDYTEPNWEAISISDQVDGIQVRRPTGAFEDGLSAGFSNYTDTPVEGNHIGQGKYISTLQTQDINCQWIGDTISDFSDFSCNPASLEGWTPGHVNSNANESFRNGLLECSISVSSSRSDVPPVGSPAASQQGNRIQLEKLQSFLAVSPNPFSEGIKIKYKSAESGPARLRILSVRGETLLSRSFEIQNQQTSTLDLQIRHLSADALYLLEFSFPDGNISYVRLARVLN